MNSRHLRFGASGGGSADAERTPAVGTPQPPPVPLKFKPLPVPPSRLGRWLKRLAPALGLRRGVLVDGCYFKELTAEPIGHALSRRGPGYKDYRVTFPDGSKLVIRCTHRRIFADIAPRSLVHTSQARFAPIVTLLRPGSRIVEVGSGTGFAAVWLGAMVGPSGAIVSLSHDDQAIAFASRRYLRPHGDGGNISFEPRPKEALLGEPAGSFDAAVCIGVLHEVDPTEREALLRELWRVVGKGGWLYVSVPTPPEPEVSPPPPTSSVPRRERRPSRMAPEQVVSLVVGVTSAVDARASQHAGPHVARMMICSPEDGGNSEAASGTGGPIDPAKIAAGTTHTELVVFKGVEPDKR